MTKLSSAARRAAVLLALSGVLGGCATVNHPNARDPWEPFNRSVSQFNEGVDSVVLKPVATVYRQAVPPLVRTGVSNFFGNLSDVWSFVNSALQFKLQNATENFARVQINTMVGLFGIFDVASELNIDRHTEDFGQTLGHWGVPSGPYLVLPLFGPSTLRDAAAMPIDRRLDLAQRIHSENLRHTVYAVRAVDRRSNLLRVGNVLEEAALDKYSFTRDAHLQRRRAEVFERDDDPRAIPPVPPEEPAARPASAPAPAR
jgi:phospholipid-binding lipoprotein MlaA